MAESTRTQKGNQGVVPGPAHLSGVGMAAGKPAGKGEKEGETAEDIESPVPECTCGDRIVRQLGPGPCGYSQRSLSIAASN